jgi:hypothetical protein
MSRNRSRTTSNKSRRGHSKRITETKELRTRFLIICEGTQTEPKYFKSFRVPINVIEVNIIGLGKNPSQVVKKAKELKSQEGYEEKLDQIWCVFDRDNWSSQDFNQAIQDAYKAGFSVAYSNEAFELWYVLHFCYLNTGVNRKQYQKQLNNYLGYPYQKNSDDMYEKIEDKQKQAIKNAEKLLQQYPQTNPANENPSTTVHLLVKELNKFIP